MKILIIVAHPDDEILGMGGTILKHTKKGDDVTIVYLTTGIASRRSSNYNNSPSYKLSKNESIKIKKQILELQNDAKNSAKILGVKKTIFFDYPDNELDTIPLLKIIKTVEEVVSRIKPDRIPNYFINIENELASKIKAMKIYKNEVRKFPHPRSIENIKISAKRWGAVCGFNAAEAFEVIRKFEK